MRLVLASASPRRRELLIAAGFEFDVDPAVVSEARAEGEAPAAYVERIAREKAASVAQRHPSAAVLGADTVVVIDDEILGKPAGPADAARMLRRLSGRVHEVLTGVAVVWRGKTSTAVDRTTVWMNAIDEDQVEWYVSSGEPLDKAGAYAIQGLASRFIPRIEGSYSNVVGLPVATVLHLMRRSGIGYP